MIYEFPTHTPKLSEMIEYGFKLLETNDHIQDTIEQFERKYPGRLYVLEYCLENRTENRTETRNKLN